MSEKVLRSPIWSLVFVWSAGIIYILMSLGRNANLSEKIQSVFMGILPILAILVLLFIALWAGMISNYNQKNPKRKISLFTVVPLEFRDEDEGMQWLTNKACRKVYMFFWSALPLSYVFLFFLSDVPYVPIAVIMFLATGQFLIYWSEIRKADRE
ncbi:hypothetical protein [Bacillus sp. J33]|uniref:hypothetical protein n=1 Tax=Bacillus sp. J33 TaxID=935836 RepID=UPI0006872178|nr:hypothetical protein [Bacillus sp. J33]